MSSFSFIPKKRTLTKQARAANTSLIIILSYYCLLRDKSKTKHICSDTDLVLYRKKKRRNLYMRRVIIILL